MPDKITRRDFLKLAGTSSLSIPIARLNNLLKVQQKQPNIIIVVFDALSARNISLYGYQRDTMPNLSRLLDRAVVYHRHYASGNYTIPGTASLLTGTFPWTHRAFRHNEAPDESFFRKNIFTAFEDYYSITYTHNQWALTVLNNLSSDVDEAVPWEKLLLTTDKFIPKLFENDLDIATLGWVRSTKRKENGYSYSLFFPNIYERFRNFQVQNLQGQYPRGVPSMHADTYFLLEDAINWVGNKVSNLVPGNRLLRTHCALRRSGRSSLPDRPLPPTGRGRDSRLGPGSLPARRLGAAAFRRHAPLRTRRSETR